MDWIKDTLANPNAERFQGWVSRRAADGSRTGQYVATRRTELLHGNFIVVIQFSMGSNGVPQANFITCFVANRPNVTKIRSFPRWDMQKCLDRL